LVVICAEQYASRLVVPQSQRTPATPWGSHKDHACKALDKLAAPHLPASLAQLRKAVERAHREASAAADATSDHDENESVAPVTTEDRGDDVSETDGAPTSQRAGVGRRLSTRHPG
jgi:hypothetical protein